MNPQTKYLLVSSAFITLSYFVYLIVFRKERNFKQRRFYLLAGVILSFLIPFANIYIKLPASSQIQKQVHEKSAPFNFHEPQNNSQNIAPAFIPQTTTQQAHTQRNINWWQLITYLHFAVSAVLILRIILQILILQIRVWQSTVINKSNFKLVVNNYYKSSFSFFNWIFVHSEIKQDADLDKIISHERVHVREKHSVDTILFELVCALMWFNPFVWVMRNSIQLVHEFLADEGALKTGINQLQYQALMINQVAEADVITLTSHFNSSILKKRINMIINGDKYAKTKFRILAILPVSLLLFIIIACVNGLNEQKVMERKMRKNETISKTFNREEIADLAKIRVLVDNMIQNQTGQTDSKKAFEEYISYLGESKTVEEIKNKILLPHDSLILVMQENSTFQEVWKTGSNSQYTNVALNREGKIIEFVNQLSKENPHYLSVIQGIEIAGDISPANISDFIKQPENYNWKSEAEKLYASVLLVILTNKNIPRNVENNFKNSTTTKSYNMGLINVVVSQLKNIENQEDFLCHGTIQTFKNNIPVDSLKFNDMEAVGDSYGLNFSSQPIPDLIIGLKFGDYDGRLIIIPETGKIENYPGGPFFIPKNKNLIVSPWHSDLSGITIYDVEKKKVVMQKELPVYLSNWYNFKNEYYSARWDNNAEINEIYKLDLEKFELVKSEKTLAEIKTGEKVEYYDFDCACN